MYYALGALLLAALGWVAALFGKRKLRSSAQASINAIVERAKTDAEQLAKEQLKPLTEQEALNELRKTIDAGRADN